MNRSEPLEKLIYETFSAEGLRTGMDERILNDAFTVMKQAYATRQDMGPVSEWRRIMKSRLTQIAAIVVIALGMVWVLKQVSQTNGTRPTMLALLNAAAAAENGWFTGEQTVHIVNEIVIHARADGDDLARMLQVLETDYDESKRVAFTRLVLVQRWLPIYSLEANGNLHLHKLELVDPNAAGATVTDHIWYDPVTGRYTRILLRKDQILFAHAFDGQQVHLAQRDAQGELNLQSKPVTAAFAEPRDPEDFLGLTAGIRHILPQEEWAALQELEPETTLQGDTVRVYKLGLTDPWEELDTYQLLYVDQEDESIVKIECVVDKKPTLSIERRGVTQGELPPAGWNLMNLQGRVDALISEVAIQADNARVGLTVEEMADRARFPVYVFAQDPPSTREREIVDVLDPASLPNRVMIVLYHTEVEGYVILLQSKTATRYITTSLKKWQEQGYKWHPLYTSAHGFKLYDIFDFGDIDWVLGTIYSQLKVKSAPNQNGYVFETPEGQYILMGVNGWMPSHELEQLTDALIPAEDYLSTKQTLPKLIPDLELVTHTDLEHNGFIDRWLLLGDIPLDPHGIDTSEESTQKRAFTENQLDAKAIPSPVHIDDRDYDWTVCYGNVINLGRVFGEDRPALCYARALINMPKQVDTVWGIGSDDAVRVWLNGELIHDHWVTRGNWVDSDIVPVNLQQGDNELLIKILNKGGPWGLSCRYKDPVKAPRQTGCFKRPELIPVLEREIDTFRTLTRWKLDADMASGVAVALVDKDGILWTEGFGETAAQGGHPVTPDTPFLTADITKLVSAGAILRAVQDGVLDLDTPISRYLPNFTINSRFEESPEDKITLRHLLSHMSGLPKEARVGNNYDSQGSFHERVKSLKGTWMTFPVGVTHQYSQAGCDLAAYILQAVSGKPLGECLQQRILGPLGMTNSVLCTSNKLAALEPAEGRHRSVKSLPVRIPQVGGDGLYSTVMDLANLLQMLLQGGQIEAAPFLTPDMLAAMQKPYNYDTNNWEPYFYYGLGIKIQRPSQPEGVTLYFQRGESFGFGSELWWSPELGLGMVVLTNQHDTSLSFYLAREFRERLLGQRPVNKRLPAPDLAFDQAAGIWWDGEKFSKSTPYQSDWSTYCDTYQVMTSGFEFKDWAKRAIERDPERNMPIVKIFEKDGFLCITENSHWGIMHSVDTRLDEIQSGVFAHHGYTLDFTGEIPTWKNYRLEKMSK